MISGLSPIEEHNRLRRRPEWVSKRDFIFKVEEKLKELGVFNQVIDSVKLAMSLERVHVRAKDLGQGDVGAQCVKHVEKNGNVYGVITLNIRRHPYNHQWDCAHELIHLWFHPPNDEIDPGDLELMRIYDIQANWGAKEVKLPRTLFASTYAKLITIETNIEQALSNFFGVGTTAVRNRIDELKREGLLQHMIRHNARNARRNGIMTGRELKDFIQSQQRHWLKVFNADEMQTSSGESEDSDPSDGESGAQRAPTVIKLFNWRAFASKGEVLKNMAKDQEFVLPRELFPECPRCGNDDFHENGRFCWRCGLPRFNECTRGNPLYDLGDDVVCGEYNRMDARFCEMCGAPTQYYKMKFLSKWNGDDDSDASNVDDFNPDDVPF